jgi:hypothetical protein
MELDASLPWLALTMTPGIVARLSARLLADLIILISQYCTQMAERLRRELAARGITVVIGMVCGIDAISYQGDGGERSSDRGTGNRRECLIPERE